MLGPPASAQEACSPALYFLSRGDFDRARSHAGRDDGSPAARLNIRGVAEMMSGRQKEATATLRSALLATPDYLPARLNLGIALFHQGLHAEAAAELERVYQIDSPLRASAAYHRGLAAMHEANLEAATLWFERAIASDAGIADAYLQLGQVQEQMGALQLAGRSYRRYLEHHPESPTGLLRFGVAAQRAGHIETARRYLRLVIDVAPGSAEAVEARKFIVMWD